MTSCMVTYCSPRSCARGSVTGRAVATTGVPPQCLSTMPSTSGRHAASQLPPASHARCRYTWRAARVIAQADGKRTSSSVSSSLIAVLKDEIKYERESYRRSELIVGDPPNEFELQEVRGSTLFLLTKQFGNEEIIVRVDLDSQIELEEEEEGEEYEEEDEEGVPVEFQVTIGKDGEDTLVFDCESDGEYLTINRVALENIDEEVSGAPPYKGPVFQDLDDTLQQAFVDYLEERGVNAYLGEYIRIYLEDKATLEYQQWLSRVREFIGR